jgi:Sortase domain
MGSSDAPTTSPSSAPASATASIATASPTSALPTGRSGGPPAITPPPGTRVATRVVIPALNIDLPVVVPPAGSAFPLCNVAMYLPSLAQPGQPGATYLYAHARVGMFLPILDASLVNNGAAMIGMVVQVYTSDDRMFLYTVTEVRRHQRSLTDAINATAQELWLQTSEGPSGAYPKVQLVARPLSRGPASYADAHPVPRPVVCS